MWRSVATNIDGTILIAGSFSHGLYVCKNSVWVKALSYNYAFYSVATDTTGQFQVAGAGISGIYSSNDYGSTWIQSYKTQVGNFNIKSTYSGNQIIAVYSSGSGGGILIGIIPSIVALLPTSTESSILNIITQTPDQTLMPIQAPTESSILNIITQTPDQTLMPNEYIINWSLSSAPIIRYSGIATDNSGQYLAACTNETDKTVKGRSIYTSSDYGNTWIAQIAPLNLIWISIISNGTGQYLFATANGGIIYKSSDYGVTWLQMSSINWKCITCDSTGQYLAACESAVIKENEREKGGIYTSSDYGNTWILQTSTPIASWHCISSSINGQFLIATCDIFIPSVFGYNMYLYTSSDYGSTWINDKSAPGGSVSVATNNDGTCLIAANYDSLYVYNNSIWTLAIKINNLSKFSNSLNKKMFKSVAIDTTGQFQLATCLNEVHTSSDYGLTWSISDINIYTRGREIIVKSTYSGNQIIAAYLNKYFLDLDGGGILIGSVLKSDPLPKPTLAPTIAAEPTLAPTIAAEPSEIQLVSLNQTVENTVVKKPSNNIIIIIIIIALALLFGGLGIFFLKK